MAGTFYHALDSYVFMAIAFFILAGGLMSSAGVAEKIVSLSDLLVGKIKGGMVAVAVVSSLFMASLTGSGLPSIAALIPILVEPLEKYGYEKRYTTAVICCSCFLGYLIPPSVPVLIYSMIAHQSVAALFLATIIPGLLLAGGYLVLNYFICGKYMHFHKNKENIPDLTKKEKINIIYSSLPALGCPLLVLGSIYGGICTPNEAGCLAVIYTLLVGLWVYRKLNMKNIFLCTQNCLVTLGVFAVLIPFGTILARTFALEGLTQAFAPLILNLFQNKVLILVAINLFLIILGMFIDNIPILILVTPLLIPIATSINMNFVHLGVVIILNAGIGMITPPYADAVFLGSRLTGIPFEKLLEPVLLYLCLVALPVLILTTYIPALSCWLPTLIMGTKIVGTW
jgi:tripartite ATP-independent transporter DctM subunit